MKPCIQCGKLTDGSVGRAGIRWPMICQPCKDKADDELDEQLKIIHDNFRRVMLKGIDPLKF